METPLDKEIIKSSVDPGIGNPFLSLGYGKVAWKAAGINNPLVAKAINEDMV